jgi:sensor histidine kinase regulating citrate/malate metabolism
MDQEARRVSLRWKIGGIFTGVMITLAIFVIVAVYQITRGALRDQLDQRVLAIAHNLSDAAGAHLLARNRLALHALARKYTLLNGVAYAVIQDGKGEIVAHTFGTIPPEFPQGVSANGQHQAYRRELSWEGKLVYEASVPVHEGRAGSVHIGFWGDTIEKEIQRAVLPVIGIIAVMPFVGALLAFLLAYWIVRPIVGLTAVADKVTMGDLETSVSGKCVQSRDEIGDLARSLERMRSSLKAAMLRIGPGIA